MCAFRKHQGAACQFPCIWCEARSAPDRGRMCIPCKRFSCHHTPFTAGGAATGDVHTSSDRARRRMHTEIEHRLPRHARWEVAGAERRLQRPCAPALHGAMCNTLCKCTYADCEPTAAVQSLAGRRAASSAASA